MFLVDKLFFRVIFFLCILLASWSEAECKTVNVVTFYYPPFMNGDGSGLAEKLHIASFQEMGYEVAFEYYPQNRARKVFRAKSHCLFNGANEFANSDIASDIRFFGAAYVQIVIVFIKDCFPELKKIETLEGLKDKTIGCQFGAGMIPVYQKAGLIVDLNDSLKANFRKLQAGRIDFLSTIDLTAKKIINDQFSQRESEFSMLVFNRVLGGLTVKKGSLAQDAFDEYKKGFKAIREKGIYLKILEEFYGPGKVPESVRVSM